MKHWLCLLLMPSLVFGASDEIVVTGSTVAVIASGWWVQWDKPSHSYKAIYAPSVFSGMYIGFEKMQAIDMAEALNEAHERRMHPNNWRVIDSTIEIKNIPMRDDMPCIGSPMFPCPK